MKLLLSFLFVIVLPVSNLFFVPPISAQEERNVGLQSPPASRYYALVIGNNAYQQLPKLKTAEEDARQVASLLREVYGFETKVLLNATRAQIVSALNVYRRELSADSNLLIYYAGHGINDTDADKAYWLPVDASREDTSNWIIADEITTSIKVIPAKHILVVADSCYSGTLTRGLGELLPRPTEREQFLKKMALGRSRTLMASGGNEPVADGGGGKHSVFAKALLRGLREMDKTQFTAAELFRSYVEESVAGRANQTPEYNPLRNSGHEAGDFIFVKIRTDGKQVETRVTAPTNAPSTAPATAPAIDPSAFELEFWNAIKTSTDPADYKDYLEKYPNGQFAAIARRRANPPVETAKQNKPSATPSQTPESEFRAAPSDRTPAPPEQPEYVARCVFYQDPVSYFITSGDDIIGVAPTGQTIQVGKKIPPTVPGFIWMYSTPVITYGVDSEGKIWNRDAYGRPFQVGYVTKP